MGKKNKQGVGRSIIKDRSKAGKGQHGTDGWRHTSEIEDGSEWARLNLSSVTEQSTLDDFLATAELAGTEFTAEKLNITVVTPGQHEGSLSGVQTEAIRQAQDRNKELLRIPRRPAWDESTTAEELGQRERDSFVEWRRQLAKLQEQEHILITPFEKNLDFWRQLWRVIERSDVIVQIVDARNPLLFRCEDLEKYVNEVDSQKTNLLLMNKADFLTPKQRMMWAHYFRSIGVKVAFWSALAETERLAEERETNKTADEYTERTVREDNDDRETILEDTLPSKFAELLPTGEISPSGNVRGSDQQEQTVIGLNTDQKQTAEKQAYHERSEEEQEQEIAQGRHPSEEGDISLLKNAYKQTEFCGKTVCSGAPKGVDSVTKAPANSNSCCVGKHTHVNYLETAQNSQQAALESSGALNHELQDHTEGPLDTQDRLEAVGSDCTGALLTSSDLLELFRDLHRVAIQETGNKSEGEFHTTVGLVGYPNVGKSSTINAILQDKKVPVSATPGRTKHFQTLNVGAEVSLCDCPGLVYPSFVSTKAEMVVNGILPIDQLRDHIPPVALRIPRSTLEAVYGISIEPPKEGEDPSRPPHASEMLNAYGYMRGYMTSHGLPDGPRSARYILKDYVQGKLLYCIPPPGVDGQEFQDGRYSTGKFSSRMNLVGKTKDKKHAKQMSDVDKDFFHQEHVKTFTKGVAGFSYCQTSAPPVTPGGMESLPNMGGVYKPWKKHFNKNKREKLRRLVKN